MVELKVRRMVERTENRSVGQTVFVMAEKLVEKSDFVMADLKVY